MVLAEGPATEHKGQVSGEREAWKDRLVTDDSKKKKAKPLDRTTVEPANRACTGGGNSSPSRGRRSNWQAKVLI